MRVLVLGGTGYVGRRITEQLVARGDEVTVVSRGRLQPGILGQVEHLALDRKDRPTFETAFQARHFDAVMDNIAYEREDVESALRAFRGRAGQYIFTSSVAVYDRASLVRPLLESDAVLTQMPGASDSDATAFHPTRGQAYAVGKRQAELALVENSADLPFTALRAPIVVGPDDRTQRIWWFVQRLQGGGPLVIPDWGPGRVFQVVFADDLARAFVLAMENPSARCKAYNIAQPDVFSPESWIEALAVALGVRAESVRIPESLLAPAGLSDYAMPIAGRPFGYMLMDTAAAREELGLATTPLQDWVATTARGCAGSRPAADSAGYAGRAEEIAVASRWRELQQELHARFARAS
jgi:nucleoside-diphosphate-sugar epimerase